MCARYNIDHEIVSGLRAFLEQAGETLDPAFVAQLRFGDVLPSDTAPILRVDPREPRRLHPARLPWGLSGSAGGKSLLINARAETALTKPLFAQAIQTDRIIAPASVFYEWTSDKQKVTFGPQTPSPLLLAGFASAERFILLTTAANASLRGVHDRMPLLLPPALALRWLLDPTPATDLLRYQPALLTRSSFLEQGQLFQTSFLRLRKHKRWLPESQKRVTET